MDNGFAEEVVEDEEPKNGHYLQSHAVYREDHDKTKTRCVLNGAAIVESNNLLPNTKFGKPIDWKKSKKAQKLHSGTTVLGNTIPQICLAEGYQQKN